MNGAQSLVHTLIKSDVEVCFTNPGTSEMHFVAALDSVVGMRCALCLFEGGATGAADGYYRMARKPASTLLHLGPGLANGLSNLHNAKKAHSGIVNIVGEHAIDHIALNAPLTSDIEGIARPVSHWVRSSKSSKVVAQDGADAVAAANHPAGQIATLILPGDTAWGEAGNPAEKVNAVAKSPIDFQKVLQSQQALSKTNRGLILVGGDALEPHHLLSLSGVTAKMGCSLMSDWANSRMDRGAGRISIERIPFAVDKALELLKKFDTIVLIGASPPVAFFAYPGKPGVLSQPGTNFIALASIGDDIDQAIDLLADTVKSNGPCLDWIVKPVLPIIPTGDITPSLVGAVLGALMPENAIVVDESVSTGREFFSLTSGSPQHTWLYNCGGSIGYGLPVATGAAIACPDRKVIALEGDGSAMYTVQSLWTMARENLDILILIFSNRSYNILKGELKNVGVIDPGPIATKMLSLREPDLDWLSLSKGMGVDACLVKSGEQLVKAMKIGLAFKGPYLIEIEL